MSLALPSSTCFSTGLELVELCLAGVQLGLGVWQLLFGCGKLCCAGLVFSQLCLAGLVFLETSLILGLAGVILGKPRVILGKPGLVLGLAGGVGGGLGIQLRLAGVILGQSRLILSMPASYWALLVSYSLTLAWPASASRLLGGVLLWVMPADLST
jgi:hypothetical protein